MFLFLETSTKTFRIGIKDEEFNVSGHFWNRSYGTT